MGSLCGGAKEAPKQPIKPPVKVEKLTVEQIETINRKSQEHLDKENKDEEKVK